MLRLFQLGDLSLKQRIGVAAATVVAAGGAAGGVVAVVDRDEPSTPLPSAGGLPAASPECQGVKPSANVVAGTLSDGRTWRAVLHGAQTEAQAGSLSAATARSVCQIQVDALTDLRRRLTP